MVKNNKYKLYLYFSIVLMVAIFVSTIMSFPFLKALFDTAVVINSIILLVFLSSVAAAFRYILLVCRDIRIFSEFTDWCDNPDVSNFDIKDIKKTILGTVLGAISCSIQERGLLVLNSSTDSRSIVEGFEQNISPRALLISFMGGFLVLLGLMGTFLGLTITLQSMGEILSTLAGGLSDASDTSILQMMIQLIVELKNPMSGMGTAFSTSLFGLSGSAVIGILSVLLSRMHDELKERLQTWLNEKTEFASKSPTGGAAAFPMDAGVSAQLEAISTQLAKNNEDVLNVLENTNKFLLKLTILQQRSAESINTVQNQSIETTKEIGLGNELTGRLIKESRQISVAIERSIEALKGDG
ncbi:MAG: hypothetical protein BA863_09960 [Desulfovibrio sp. S3730MH75]|nr:MAG: hypothetical protein BA863_09960 [Desulfovibrio sp. S3730MH75]